MRDQQLELSRVVDHPGHDLSGLLVGVIAQGQALQLVVAHLRQVGDEIPRRDMRLPHGEEAEQHPEQVGAEQDEHIGEQQPTGERVRGAEGRGQTSHGLGRHQIEQGCAEQGDDRNGEIFPPGPRDFQHSAKHGTGSPLLFFFSTL